MGTMPWYVEKWYEEDLKTALKEAGVPVTERRIARLRDAPVRASLMIFLPEWRC